MTSQEERDFEPPSSTTKRKPMTSPRAARLSEASSEDSPDLGPFGRPKSWQQYDKRGESDEHVLLSPFGEGQHHARSYHHSQLRSSEKQRNRSQNIHRTPSTEQPMIDYPDPDTMDEDIGADYLSLDMPMGSFTEDSPPRPRRTPSKREEREGEMPPHGSPKASATKSTVYHPFGGPATYHHPPSYYQKSPRGSSYPPPMYYTGPPPTSRPPSASKTSASATRHPRNAEGPSPNRSSSAPPPPQHYAYPPHARHGYPHYYPYPPPPSAEHHHPHYHPHWASPKPYDEMFRQGSPLAKQGNAREAFRASPPRRSPMPPSTNDGADSATPEKMKPMRSPFRSPPLSQTKGKSPMLLRSPALGGYGSFGMMDTPGGTLAAEFSPMGPMLHDPFTEGFAEGAPTPPKLPMSRSHSDEGNMDEDHEPHDVASPFSGFINDFNYVPPPPNSERATTEGLLGVPRSPLRSEKRSARVAAASAPRTTRSASMQAVSTSIEKQASATRVDKDGAQPRKLWNGPDPSRPMRLELGNASSQRKSLDSINTMMKNQVGPPATTPSIGAASQAPPNSTFRNLNTPIKLEPSPVQGKSETGATTAGTKRSFPPSAPNSSLRDPKIAKSGGKENKGVKNGKRQPCNCKKSKCLKLYCECFSAELFCDGCNCGDCKNTAQFKEIRDKAIKDTRAKNPNAFKPRIGVKGPMGLVAAPGASPQTGHNMGCRCKRSECLKKYCECFQAGVMCGGKCKCKDCMNFAGSQKLIDKRRKIKDQRGADLAMKAADQTWKGQQSSRKLPVARPAVHGMRPMPSPVATPGGRMPMANPNMMNPSPSGHPNAPPYHMRHPYMGHHYGHMGYSPMGYNPHMSPAYGMFPPHPPIPTPVATKKQSPSASTSKAMAYSSTKATPSRRTTTPTKAAKTDSDDPPADKHDSLGSQTGSKTPEKSANGSECNESETKPTAVKEALPDDKKKSESSDNISSRKDESVDKPLSSTEASPISGVAPKSEAESTVQPTPSASEKPAVSKVTPMPPTPASAVRVSYDHPSTKEKCRVGDAPERTYPFFGKLPEQPKSTVLAIFSFLSNADLSDGAGLVCKEWNRLAKDEALWNFQS